MMKRILLDENIPVGLAQLLTGCEAHHVHDLSWAGMTDSALLVAAENAGFDVFVTADQNLIHQQNMRGKRMAIVALSSNNWPRLKARCRDVEDAIALAAPGTFRSLPVT